MNAIEFHKAGKIEVQSKVPLRNKKHLTLAYTPGVGSVSSLIKRKKERVFDYTMKSNSVAVVTDGSAVLGLGDVGAEAALPVMEGKAVLFKKFGCLDAFPICLETKNVKEITKTVEIISPVFGGINLEDISAPRCFEIEEMLKTRLKIPVMHDDQHGTAIVVLASLINALKIVKKDFEEIKVVISGAGAAGIAIAKILISQRTGDIILCDTKGILYKGRKMDNPYKDEIAKKTNKERLSGTLEDALKGADVFIGVSAPGIVKKKMVSSMKEPIVFALANPMPEIMPSVAKRAGAKIVATGRSDLPNQINNVLAFPGVFRGALDAKAKEINEEMKIEAAKAIASLVSPKKSKIIPDVFDLRVHAKVAESVARVVRKIEKNYYRKTLNKLKRLF